MNEAVIFVANIVASVIGGGLIGGLVAWRRTKSQNDLDLSKAWRDFVAPLMTRLDTLEKKVKGLEVNRRALLEKIDALEKVVDAYKNWAERLVNQLEENGFVPVPYERREEERE